MLIPIFEKIEALTKRQKALSLSGIIIILLGGFLNYVFLPKSAEIAQREEEISVLNTEINVRQIKARRLEELKREYQILRAQLAVLEKRLPPEGEVEILLKQVSELGERSNLLVKLWRPGEKRPNESGIYTEIPMSVEVSGGYHSLGTFFERVGELHRIVTISNIHMGNPKTEGGRFFVETSFLATTFSVIEKMSVAPASVPPAPGPG
jgi:type IV pilus assembly protein PilO